MSWDAVLMGVLTFDDAAALVRWKQSRAIVAKARWPSILAPVDDDIGTDQGVVGVLLADLAKASGGHEYFEATEMDRSVTFRGLLSEDVYSEIATKLVAVLATAGACGASGRVDVRNAGAYTGGRVELRAGRMQARELGRTLSPEDEGMMRDALRGPRATKPVTASPSRVDPKIARLQGLPRRSAAQERDLKDLLQIAMIKENRRGASPADVKDAIKRVETRMKVRAKRKT